MKILNYYIHFNIYIFTNISFSYFKHFINIDKILDKKKI